MKPKISVSIVNWNGGVDIVKCLQSLYAQTYKDILEVIVVDNDSKDGSLEVIEKKFSRIVTVRNDFNMGFCKAHNQAIRIARGEHLLLLNFDILLEPDFLGRMVTVMESSPKIGMVSGKLRRSINGEKSKLLDSTGITMFRYFSAPRGENEEDTGQYDGPECRSIFGPCGAAPLYRRAMLEDIRVREEYFDEDFVNYVEDVDLAWRAQLRGWRGVYVPEAVAYHERGATRKSNPQEQYNYYLRGFRNRYLAMYKNITDFEWKRTGHKITLGELAFLLSCNDKMNCASIHWKALFEARRLNRLFRLKRVLIQSRLRISPEEMMSFFDYEKFSFFHSPWNIIKSSIHQFLCQFRLGQILIRRYQMLKRRLSGP